MTDQELVTWFLLEYYAVELKPKANPALRCWQCVRPVNGRPLDWNWGMLEHGILYCWLEPLGRGGWKPLGRPETRYEEILLLARALYHD